MLTGASVLVDGSSLKPEGPEFWVIELNIWSKDPPPELLKSTAPSASDFMYVVIYLPIRTMTYTCRAYFQSGRGLINLNPNQWWLALNKLTCPFPKKYWGHQQRNNKTNLNPGDQPCWCSAMSTRPGALFLTLWLSSASSLVVTDCRLWPFRTPFVSSPGTDLLYFR